MSDSGLSKFATLLLTSLIFSSVAVSYFLLSIYGISVATVAIPSLGNSFSSSQDFSTSCNYNSSIVFKSGSSSWNCNPSVGLILEHTPMNVFGYALLDYIQKDANDNVVNNYQINNSVHGDFSIVLKYTGGIDQNEILVRKDGFYIPWHRPDGVMLIGYNDFIAYGGANQIDKVSIQTQYNDKDHKVTFIYNGQQFTTDKLNADSNILGLFGRYYGGVSSNTEGFTVEKFNSNNAVSSVNADINPLVFVGAFIQTMFAVLIWNVDPAFLPWELNLILIKSQIAGLAICIVALWRG